MLASDPRTSVLEVKNVSKTFAGTRALREVSLSIRAGEILALAGGNGSGKSTLIKILAGVYHADEGSLEADGREFDLAHFNPGSSRECGMHFVHQSRSTFLDLTVAENLSIGRGFETGPLYRLNRRALQKRCQEVLDRFRIDAHPDAELRSLRPSAQTMVAIARALQDQETVGQGVLAVDEATASLAPAEAGILLDALKGYAADGQAIIFVTHRLDEVLDLADRVAVLRDGVCVDDSFSPADGHDRLVELIAGRTVDAFIPVESPPNNSRTALEVKNLRGGSVKGVDLSVNRGEIVGITGIVGSGCSTFLRMVFGAQPSEAGEILIEGETARITHPADAMAKGIAYVPPDRLEQAMFPDDSVRENMSIATLGRYWRSGWLHTRRERKEVEIDSAKFRVVAASQDMPLSQLSGGNQQKVMIARWLRRDPKLLLLDEPTQGVDVGARADVWALVKEAVENGASTVVASSDIEELTAVCNRILIFQQGTVVHEATGSDLNAERIVELQHARYGEA